MTHPEEAAVEGGTISVCLEKYPETEIFALYVRV
jgi:hypothetical protein